MENYTQISAWFHDPGTDVRVQTFPVHDRGVCYELAVGEFRGISVVTPKVEVLEKIRDAAISLITAYYVEEERKKLSEDTSV
jgi:hypothetical protein